MPAILFVCTGNRYRSPIAQAAFQRKLKEACPAEQWVVDSAGTWTEAGLPPVGDAVEAAAELGLDIAAHTSTPIMEDEIGKYDLILVMESGQKEAILNEFPQLKGRVFLLTEMTTSLPHDIPDPLSIEDRREAMAIAAEICDLVAAGFENIVQTARRVAATRG